MNKPEGKKTTIRRYLAKRVFIALVPELTGPPLVVLTLGFLVSVL
jgi:hypothetical protein